MINAFLSNPVTDEFVLQFNQHSYNYLFSTLKNAMYPNYRNMKLPEMDNINVINCMKLFTIIYYKVERQAASPTSSGYVQSGYNEVTHRFGKVHEGLVKAWLEYLERAAFIFVEYDTTSFRATWNKENVWIKKAIGFRDNGRYTYFKYSPYNVCSIVIPEEAGKIELASKYIKNALNILNDYDTRLYDRLDDGMKTLLNVLKATNVYAETDERYCNYKKALNDLAYFVNLVDAADTVLNKCMKPKETT